MIKWNIQFPSIYKIHKSNLSKSQSGAKGGLFLLSLEWGWAFVFKITLTKTSVDWSSEKSWW